MLTNALSKLSIFHPNPNLIFFKKIVNKLHFCPPSLIVFLSHRGINHILWYEFIFLNLNEESATASASWMFACDAIGNIHLLFHNHHTRNRSESYLWTIRPYCFTDCWCSIRCKSHCQINWAHVRTILFSKNIYRRENNYYGIRMKWREWIENLKCETNREPTKTTFW